MKIRFLGGVREVTGSTHLLLTKNSTVMRDCGLFQGHRKDAREKCKTVCDSIEKLDAVVLSHAHIDHCGNLPTLAKHGFTGPVHATHATKDLCEYMLRDSVHIQELDAAYLNKKNQRASALAGVPPAEPPVEPLYSLADAEAILACFKGHAYHERVQVTDDIAVTPYEAGHILGAALHVFDVRENGRTMRIGYAFDLGRSDLPLINDPEQLTDIDALVIESTYGNRVHRDIRQADDLLAGVINRTYQRGGKLIIPSFALERAQEIVYTLNNLYKDKRVPRMPVYIDSPLTVSISEVFRRHVELFDDETKRLIASGGWVLRSDLVSYISSVEESKALNDDPRPMIIISASGMCEMGRILHHLKNNVEDPRNTVCIVGYQAEGTLGRKIVERAPELKIFGKTYQMRAERVVLNTFSGHADRNDLIAFVDGVSNRCKTFVFVHGEDEAITSFASEVQARRPGARMVIPARGDEVEF